MNYQKSFVKEQAQVKFDVDLPKRIRNKLYKKNGKNRRLI